MATGLFERLVVIETKVSRIVQDMADEKIIRETAAAHIESKIIEAEKRLKSTLDDLEKRLRILERAIYAAVGVLAAIEIVGKFFGK